MSFMSCPLDKIVYFIKNYTLHEIKTIFFHSVKYLKIAITFMTWIQKFHIM